MPSKSLILYIHGGGFVANTSSAHELYLRTIASKVDVPIISIDYSVAPEAPYPRAIEEVFYAYCWILNHPEFCGSTLERIGIISESAGSSIIMACIIKCLQNSIRIPDRLVNVYGVCSADLSITPSRFLSLIDPILPYSLMMEMLISYTVYKDQVNNASSKEHCLKISDDPLISQMTAPDEVLRKFPAISFLCPTMDPFLDDSIGFAKKLDELGVDVTVKILPGLSHSYNNFIQVRNIIGNLLISISKKTLKSLLFQISEECRKGLLVCIDEIKKALL
jgi:hormone-sensitive lipase